LCDHDDIQFLIDGSFDLQEKATKTVQEQAEFLRQAGRWNRAAARANLWGDLAAMSFFLTHPTLVRILCVLRLPLLG
jgi:hypothetical protein